MTPEYLSLDLRGAPKSIAWVLVVLSAAMALLMGRPVLAQGISSDRQEIEQLAAGTERDDRPPTICPSCGFDNESPIDVCPRCGAIPYVRSKSSLVPIGDSTSPEES